MKILSKKELPLILSALTFVVIFFFQHSNNIINIILIFLSTANMWILSEPYIEKRDQTRKVLIKPFIVLSIIMALLFFIAILKVVF